MPRIPSRRSSTYSCARRPLRWSRIERTSFFVKHGPTQDRARRATLTQTLTVDTGDLASHPLEHFEPPSGDRGRNPEVRLMPASSRPASRHGARARLRVIAGSALLLATLIPSAAPAPVAPSHTPAPSSVTIAGDLQSEIGCPGDWDPDCAATHLTYDASDDVWQGTLTSRPATTSTRRRSTTAGTRTTVSTPRRRRQHPARPAPDGAGQVLLRPQDALGHRQQVRR